MIKKISIGLVLVVLVLLGVALVQKSKIEQKFTALLTEKGIQAEQLDWQFLPQPQFIAQGVKVRSVLAEKLILQSHWGDWLLGDLKIGHTQLINGQIADVPWLSFQLSGDVDYQQEQWQSQQLNLHFQLIQPIFNTDSFEVELSQTQFNPKQQQFQVEKLRLNQQDFGEIKGRYQLAQPAPFSRVWLEMQDSQASRLFLQIPQNSDLSWQAKGENLPLERYLQAFHIPDLVQGRASFSAKLWATQQQLKQGDFTFVVRDGVAKGVNMLELIRYYVPINFTEEQANRTNTPFRRLESQFHWNSQQLQVQQLALETPHILLQGQGVADLTQGKCDFHTRIGSTQPQYAELRLPVRFFGSCHSPEYKVEIDRSFRHQLKEQLKGLLKEKLR